jgi:hypothetical protein
MNDKELAAVKQALEALEMVAARTGARWALEQGYAGHLEAITTLQSIISQDALDKMAENARELGLSYDDNFCDKNCVWTDHHPDCKAVQELWVGLSEDEINKLRHLVDWTAEWSYGRFAYELERLLREKNARPQPAAPEFYHHVVENEGDWSEWVNPDNDSYMMKCCDCGLVHEMQFKVAKYSDGDECEFVGDPDLQPVFRARRAEEAWQETDTPPPQPVPVKTYHDGKPWPVQPAPDPVPIIQQLVTALEGSGTKMRSDQWYIEIEAVAAGKFYLNSKGANHD